jgi:dihydroorotase
MGALDKLEAFASFHGPDFYRLARNKDTITLKKESWMAPVTLPFADDELVPLRGAESVGWKLI